MGDVYVTATSKYGTSGATSESGTLPTGVSATPVSSGLVTGYTVTPTPGGFSCQLADTAASSILDSCVINGLTNYQAYAFSVVINTTSGSITVGTTAGTAPGASNVQVPVTTTLNDTGFGFSNPSSIVTDGTNLWIANTQGNSVTEINATSGALVRVLSGISFGFNVPTG
jgi:hypothetical protein